MTERHTKHTPGPWEPHVGIDYVAVKPTDVTAQLADVAHVYGRHQKDAVANASLMAAAPDLLEAVRELLATHPAAYREPNSIDNRTDNAVRIARAAVAKATGAA